MKQALILQSIVLLVGLFAQATQAYEPLVLGVPEFKPYTYTERGQIKGSAIKTVTHAFKRSGAGLELKSFANYSALLKALKRDEIQGFFLASKNLERDRYAEFSKQVTVNNWTWFTLVNRGINTKSTDFPQNAVVGTIAKTNTFRWLTRNGYQVVSAQIGELPGLLMNKRVDAVFAAEAVFEQTCREQSVALSLFKKDIQKGKPFGIYVSKTYLKRNPGFMEALNSAIP